MLLKDLKVGDKAVVRSGYVYASYREVEVTKVTATMITTAGAERWNINTGGPVGYKSDSLWLITMDSPGYVEWLEATEFKALQTKVVEACKKADAAMLKAVAATLNIAL